MRTGTKITPPTPIHPMRSPAAMPSSTAQTPGHRSGTHSLASLLGLFDYFAAKIKKCGHLDTRRFVHHRARHRAQHASCASVARSWAPVRDGRSKMAKKKLRTVLIKLVSTARTGFFYVTPKESNEHTQQGARAYALACTPHSHVQAALSHLQLPDPCHAPISALALAEKVRSDGKSTCSLRGAEAPKRQGAAGQGEKKKNKGRGR